MATEAPWTMVTTRVHLSQYSKNAPKSQSFSYGNLYISIRDRCCNNNNGPMAEGEGSAIRGHLTNNQVNLHHKEKDKDSKEKEKDKDKDKDNKEDEGKKRRFSSFINHGYNNSNKRPNAAPIRVLLLGRPLSGKSSIISMLLNRDVHPGLNGRGIFVNNKPFITTPSQPEGPTLSDAAPNSPTFQPSSHHRTTMNFQVPPLSNHRVSFSPTLSSTTNTDSSSSLDLPALDTASSDQTEEDDEHTDPLEVDSPLSSHSDKMAISPTITPDQPASPRASVSFASPPIPDTSNPTLQPKQSSFFNTGRRIYQSDKYIITDIDGFHESNTSDIVGAVLEHRKWLEESMQGYNIVLMVIKAQDITDTDRKIFALCNALLHDMKDMIHVAVTGCDMNPHWIRDNDTELRRVYGAVKAVGVAFPSTEGGLLECIFEQMRKDSLTVLEEYISKNASTNPRVPVKPQVKGGSVGSGEKKKLERTRNRTFSR